MAGFDSLARAAAPRCSASATPIMKPTIARAARPVDGYWPTGVSRDYWVQTGRAASTRKRDATGLLIADGLLRLPAGGLAYRFDFFVASGGQVAGAGGARPAEWPRDFRAWLWRARVAALHQNRCTRQFPAGIMHQ